MKKVIITLSIPDRYTPEEVTDTMFNALYDVDKPMARDVICEAVQNV